jgi:hypothetical protein
MSGIAIFLTEEVTSSKHKQNFAGEESTSREKTKKNRKVCIFLSLCPSLLPGVILLINSLPQ